MKKFILSLVFLIAISLSLFSQQKESLSFYVGPGLGGDSAFIELIFLNINMDMQTITVRYREYTKIEGQKVLPVEYQYIVANNVSVTDKSGHIIPEFNSNGDTLYWNVTKIVNGVTTTVSEPKPRLIEFTKHIYYFRPLVWTGVLDKGIKNHYQLGH